MPRQNRVTPFGEIIATPERGTFMGNRGILHDEGGSIRRSWHVRRWLICLLEFRGRHRTVMAPNRYTELFFLDEATGLAAGHRPCFECQRRRYNEFRAAWAVGNLHDQSTRPLTAGEIDMRLHADRLDATRSKRVFQANLDHLARWGLHHSRGKERSSSTHPRRFSARLVSRRLSGASTPKEA